MYFDVVIKIIPIATIEAKMISMGQEHDDHGFILVKVLHAVQIAPPLAWCL